ncbi:ribulose bisphosphate carboxylaseoxygenase large subunit [Hypericibacter adhaerens]|jgi:ribulose-bisphosphate carboxylase large chain|uniref:Ribulose bisphosphate carboxylaseoxygenase large subunit n=1 Tax=Hypericibacter adhaerens TaxID=2602016 RepID=A0A5J6N3R2_9PROT|nr:ribulose-bisphosphate carboxylase large subunit family protein [Hypericibacter adhaerens]QEX24449.1 ribulose bisphosphate carboxylaseoxygenase large subunit [Hypericibacter adhaerens]
MTIDRIEADYLIETSFPPEAAAESMAGEQSSGTFLAIPGETPELKARAAARVERLEVLGDAAAPSLPGSGSPRSASEPRRVTANVTLSWPVSNLGPSLPNLVATVAGNLFELKQFSGLRLLDIRMPAAFADAYQGPQFGIDGTRRLAGVEGAPILGTIIKPSVGFGPEETAALVERLALAGIDFIKDDELQSDGPHCPFDERARAVMAVINDVAQRTGKKAMFAFNLTGNLDQMKHRHDLVQSLGGTCIMAGLNSVGLVGMIELRRHSALPIHAHRNGWGYLSRHPMLGWSYIAWQKIWRLAGADHMHVNGLRNKFAESDDSVIASAQACLTPMFPAKPCIVMPVFSSGQTARQAPDTYRRLRSLDLIYLAGGGIMAHPGGPAGGLASIRESWEAAIANVPLEVYSRDHTALAQALETFPS